MSFAPGGQNPNWAETPNEQLRRENDFVLNKLTLVAYNGKEYNVASHRVVLSFEESIFVGTVHGSLTLLDTVDYATLLPIIGEERIRCSLTRQSENAAAGSDGSLLPPLEFDCRVYKISPREQQGTSDKMQVYTLYFCSDEYIKNLQTKVFKAYKAKPFSEIVENVYNDKMKVSKDIEIEVTKYDQDYVISNDKPYQCIKKITRRSISDEGNGTHYLFYEDREKFHFVTIGKLLKKAVVKKIKYRVQNVLKDGAAGHKDRTIEEDINSVQHYHHSVSFDIVAHLMAGKGSARVKTVDIVRQKIETIDFDLDSEYDKFNHLGDAKPFTADSPILKCPEANFNLVSTNKDHDVVPHIASKEPGIKPKKIEEYLLERQSSIEQMKRHMITATMSGDPTLKAGDIVEFVLPELLGKVSEEFPQENDRYLQGKYIIASIAHVLESNKYSMNLELIKDSFANDIEHRDPIKEYEPVF